MKHLKRLSLASLVTLIAVCGFMVKPQNTKAQDILPLTVGPARQQIIVNPGEKANFVVRFYNQSDAAMTGIINVADFTVTDTQGSTRIIDDAALASPKFSGAAWVALPYDRVTIPAQDKITVQASLDVPKDAKPGGRYVSVFFEPVVGTPQAVGNESAGTGIAPRIASLLYIRVAGNITEKASVINMFTKSFYEYGPVTVDSEVLNSGDYHIRPRGVISMSDAFGGVVDQSPLKEENIFPDAARSYENILGTKWMAGRYKLTLVASYGDKGQALERSVFVWVFPWKVATVTLLFIIILFLLVRNMYRRLVVKEATLEDEIAHEREEIEKLREELKKRKE